MPCLTFPDAPARIDALGDRELIDLYAATLAELPPQAGGWPLEEIRESFPTLAARLDEINFVLMQPF